MLYALWLKYSIFTLGKSPSWLDNKTEKKGCLWACEQDTSIATMTGGHKCSSYFCSVEGMSFVCQMHHYWHSCETEPSKGWVALSSPYLPPSVPPLRQPITASNNTMFYHVPSLFICSVYCCLVYRYLCLQTVAHLPKAKSPFGFRRNSNVWSPGGTPWRVLFWVMHCPLYWGWDLFSYIAVQCPLLASNNRQYMHIPLKGGDLFYKIPCA